MVNQNNEPVHIATIPDGNRRWAKKKKLAPWLGHQSGAKAVEKVARAAFEIKIPNLTFWVCSEDNLIKRPKKEIAFLLTLFKKEFVKLGESQDIHQNRARVRFLGQWRNYFPESLKKILNNIEKGTKNYSEHNLTFLMGYDGREEMTSAIRKAVDYYSGNSVQGEKIIDKDFIKSCLWTKDLPLVDLVIRTGGEPHLSAGFMMWDIADAQFYFTEKLWPDFGQEDLKEAVKNYSQRPRRFGY